MNLPPSKPSGDRTLTPEAADGLFDAAAPLTGGGTPIAVIAASGQAAHVTAFGLALLGATDRADFQRRLLSGDGPGARRLRRLAATLPVAEGARLERIRNCDGPRATSANVRCVRIAAPDGAAFLILTADDAVLANPAPVAPAEPIAPTLPPTASPVVVAPARSRFLWSVDKDGRFAAPDPVLASALGAVAPEAGETVEALRFRVAIENGEALASAVEKRETFADLKILWMASDGAHALPITLSGAPLFDNAREFAGFRGFGTIGEAIEAARPSGTASAPDEDKAVAAAAGPATAEDAAPRATATADGDEVDRSRLTPVAPAPELPSPPATAPPPEPAGPPDAAAAQERTAEIFILRQSAPASVAPSKIVPIRPGAFDASRPQEAGDSGDGSVELSKAEREAFREIARALVGRTQASRTDARPVAHDPPARAREQGAEAADDSGLMSPAEPEKRQPAADPDAVPVLRNALTLLDRLPIGVLVARDAQPLYVNLTLLALLGYRDQEQFESCDGLAAMFRSDARPTLSETDDGAFSIFTIQGQALAVEGRAQAIVWDGAPATLIMLRAAKPASRSDERHGDVSEASVADDLVQMLDLATDGAVALDSAGRIQSFNASAERLFGYAEKDVAGESVLMLLAPPSHPAATALLESLSRLGGPSSEPPTAVAGRDREGAPLTLSLTLARVGPPDAPHFCALFRDMRRERETERRLTAARDAALAASAAKTEFLAHVSHEIRTPLHAILGFAEVMMEERFGPIGNDRYRDYLKDIHASGRHIMSLADDLLDLSKIESGRLELAFAPVDANTLIRECVSVMQPQAARERIIMRISLFDRLPRVMVDERSLRQIMLNLMSNAVKFNEPGGQVIVSTAVDAAGQAVIRVRDTGVGMIESEVGVALEPFGQVGRGQRKGGVGLGLPLTKALVEANKAEFSIKSRRDHGTLVEICFPNVQAAQ
ncbi:histidine kinase dimerization/phospho-acceptor domain-containing protein [Roseiarcus sp.]|uniref:histidine kinase dimerization/phospho-acceptor domain-containing protein n=1 Tax=Roseiarcus sp. TaxID=1969460 RepID=UPI003F9BE87E